MPCLSTYSIGHFAGKVKGKTARRAKKLKNFSAIAGQKRRFRKKRLGRFAKCPKPATCIGGEASSFPRRHAGRSIPQDSRRAVKPAATAKGQRDDPPGSLPTRAQRSGQRPPETVTDAGRTLKRHAQGGGVTVRGRGQSQARPIIKTTPTPNTDRLPTPRQRQHTRK